MTNKTNETVSSVGDFIAASLDLVTIDTVNSFFIDLDSSCICDEIHDFHESSSVARSSINLHSNLHIDNLLSPCSIMLVKTIQGQVCCHPLRVLFDSGSDSSHIQRRAIPDGAIPSKIGKRTTIIGMTGSATVTEEIELQDIILPEFSRSLRISDSFKCLVMNSKSVYDVIFGRDFLMAVGIDILHSSQEMQWMDLRIHFSQP